jgi:20S proteasome subunit alpha 4
VREFLEKNYNEESVATAEGTIKLAVRALMEVVEAGSKNIEIAVLKKDQDLKFLEEAEIEAIVKKIEEEKSAEEKK